MRYLLLFVLLCGCSTDPRPPVSPPLDAGTDDQSTLHPCTSIVDDFFNCGECGRTCDPSNGDLCVNGFCSCGGGAPCGDASDCREGTCVPVDETGMICEFDDQCMIGFACIQSHCSFRSCVPEDCDGYDNDCDGVTDEGATPVMPLSRFCYDGGTTTTPWAIMDPCSAGVQACNEGEWSECFGEHPPIEEYGLLSCDGLDNNCDGCVDGFFVDGVCQPVVIEGLDILYAFDTSGSMTNQIAAVVEATRSFSASLGPEMRFALAAVPGGDGITPWLIHDFTEFTTFDAFLDLSFPRGAGGNEPSWDVVFEAANNSMSAQYCDDADGNGLLSCVSRGTGLSWRPSTLRIIVLFTDEEGQSYSHLQTVPQPIRHETDMCESLTHGEVLVVVNHPAHHEDFDCGGSTILFELTTDATRMAENLRTVLVDPCEGFR